jgi:Na+-driven multidrug efflux pump
MMGVVGVRVALATLFVRVLNMGLNGAWYAMAIDQFCRSLFIYFRYRSGRWKELRV